MQANARWAVVSLGGLLLLWGCTPVEGNADAGKPADAGPSADAGGLLPGTHAGQRAEAFLDFINSSYTGTCALSLTNYSTMFTADYRHGQTVTEFNTNVAKPLCDLAPLTLVKWEETATDTLIWVQLHAAVSSTWLRLGVEVQAAEPFAIDMLSAASAADLDPAVGPAGATQLDVYPYDPFTGRYLPGVPVEALDRTTGQPLVPALTVVAEAKYNLARLTLPAGVTEVGLRLTHPDSQVSYVYSANSRPGEQVLAPAFPTRAFPYYAQQAGVTLTAGKAQVWGMALYENRSARRWTSDVAEEAVGCATVSLSPTVSSLFYSAPPYYTPSTTATRTAPEWATWYAFNLDAAVYTVTAQATGNPLTLTLPPLVADVPTTVVAVFEAPSYTANPMPAGCTQ